MSTRTPRGKRARGRNRHTTLWVLLAMVAVVAGVVTTSVILTSGNNGNGSSNSSQAPVLAPVDTAATGQPVDGIQCQAMEQVLFHIHAHVAVYVGGAQRLIPAGVGIGPPRQAQTQSDGTPFVAGGSCFYWLHTHTQDGIVHIESPVQQTYTLGELFDIWNQPLGPTQVGPATGGVTAYVDGRRFTGDPRDIQLNAHTLVQLDVGQDVPPQPFSFPAGL